MLGALLQLQVLLGAIGFTPPAPTVAAIGAQPASANLDEYAGVNPSAFALTILDDANAGSALTTLGVSAFAQTLLDDANSAAAKTTLGLVIDTNVQAYDADLSQYASVTPSAFVLTTLDDATAGDFRTTISAQQSDADLDIYAGITPSDAVQTLLGAADAGEIRSAISLTDGTATLNVGATSVNGELTAYSGVTLYANTIANGASPYTVQAIDYRIFCDTAGGAVVLNLLEPGVTAFVGKTLCVKKAAGANTCTLDSGAANIDAAPDFILDAAHEAVCIYSTGSAWAVESFYSP